MERIVYHVSEATTREGVTVSEKPGHLLGRVLDQMAARRGVRGPYDVADHVLHQTGEGPAASDWSRMLSDGTHRPSPEVLSSFARAFDLSPEEMQRLAYVYTFDKEPPEGVELAPEYADSAAKFGWTASQLGQPAQEDAEEPTTTSGVEEEPSDWVGENVRAFLEPAEVVQGVLRGVTEHGVVIDVGARRLRGPRFYSWQMVRWIYPVDRQTIHENH